VLGDDWNWDQWQDIGDDDSIPGPLEMDHYNGLHGVRECGCIFPNYSPMYFCNYCYG